MRNQKDTLPGEYVNGVSQQQELFYHEPYCNYKTVKCTLYEKTEVGIFANAVRADTGDELLARMRAGRGLLRYNHHSVLDFGLSMTFGAWGVLGALISANVFKTLQMQ